MACMMKISGPETTRSQVTFFTEKIIDAFHNKPTTGNENDKDTEEVIITTIMVKIAKMRKKMMKRQTRRLLAIGLNSPLPPSNSPKHIEKTRWNSANGPESREDLTSLCNGRVSLRGIPRPITTLRIWMKKKIATRKGAQQGIKMMGMR